MSLIRFVELPNGLLEYDYIEVGHNTSTIVLLHEGLGSVAMWKDFPSRLAHAVKCNVLVYSRHGYGRSSPIAGSRSVQYMHDEALLVLPKFLDALGVERPLLIGHSDGASIALIHAGGSGRAVAGVVALAPHVMVEDISITSIAAAREMYRNSNLRSRLARYHDDVDGAFWGWNDVWLSPEFRRWNIEEYVSRILCPVLAIQGEDDEYGTMDQIDRIAQAAAHVERLKLQNCRHSPHRDRPDAVLIGISEWMSSWCMPNE